MANKILSIHFFNDGADRCETAFAVLDGAGAILREGRTQFKLAAAATSNLMTAVQLKVDAAVLDVSDPSRATSLVKEIEKLDAARAESAALSAAIAAKQAQLAALGP